MSFILIVALWITAIILFKNLKLNFYKFLIGSVGAFTIAMFFFMTPLEGVVANLITKLLDSFSHLWTGYEVYTENSILIIDTNDGIISMLINYECSGVIELLVYSSLVLFFPFLTLWGKIRALVFGNLYLIITNILRVLFIVFMVKILGIEYYNIAHTVLARIFFFISTILLYYFVFTKSQIVNQKVGEIK
ncbi:MAG: exosortase family protein XrtG [Clostridium sp.]